MLDPRIYRAGLVVAALGLIVLAFSLANQPAGSQSTLAPGAFDGQSAYASMQTLYSELPGAAARLVGGRPTRPPSGGDARVLAVWVLGRARALYRSAPSTAAAG